MMLINCCIVLEIIIKTFSILNIIKINNHLQFIVRMMFNEEEGEEEIRSV